ncbi:TraB/GumN family protein [Vibrio rumoiensis]|uniref:TraB/GumN family protein n=1 Tax=Vibrio rumoiensis TaxID=76258 RepID=UPI003AA89778
MKNWRPLLLSLLSLPSLLFATTSHAEPLVWKATKGQQQLMLIGTIHLGHKSMYPLPEVLEQFLKTSDGLVLEANLEEGMPQINFDGVTLTKQVLTSEQRKQLETTAKHLKLDPIVLLNLPPWLTAVSIENQTFESLGYDASEGVDQTIQKQAQALKVPVLTFETLAQQLDVLQNLPDNGKSLLVDAISEQGQQNEDIYSCMIQSWQDGDQDNLLKLLETSEWDQQTSDDLLYSRNQDWIKKITDPSFLSPTGHYVIAVGALHLIAEQNLIQALTDHGYHVTQVTTSNDSYCPL